MLNKYNSDETIEVKNPKELKAVLVKCNPTLLRHYKSEVEKHDPTIIISGIGMRLTLTRKQI